MKITTEVNIDINAKAVFRDGELKLSVIGSMPYGERQASATLEDGFSKEVVKAFADAFELLLQDSQDRVALRAQAAQSEALTVATRMGEL